MRILAEKATPTTFAAAMGQLPIMNERLEQVVDGFVLAARVESGLRLQEVAHSITLFRRWAGSIEVDAATMTSAKA